MSMLSIRYRSSPPERFLWLCSLPPPDGKVEAFLWDQTVCGFGTRAQATGCGVRRTWIAQTRVDGRTKRLLIEDVSVLSIQEAREAVRTRLARLRVGDDLAVAKRSRRGCGDRRQGRRAVARSQGGALGERTRNCRRTWIGHLKPLSTAPVVAPASVRAVPKTHAVICRSNRAPVMNSAASKVMVRDIPVPPSWSTSRRR